MSRVEQARSGRPDLPESAWDEQPLPSRSGGSGRSSKTASCVDRCAPDFRGENAKSYQRLSPAPHFLICE
jgi:hypothetical protein